MLIRRCGGLGAVALLLTSCGFLTPGSDGPKLVPPPGGIVEGAARIHQGDTVTIGGMFTCLDKKGSVTVDDIVPVKPTGVEVTGWAIRPNPSWISSPTTGMGQLGVSRHTLKHLQFPGSRDVDAACGENGEGVEFGVEVRKVTSEEAGIHAFKITYTSDGETKTLVYPHAVRLCNEDKSWVKTCRDVLKG